MTTSPEGLAPVPPSVPAPEPGFPFAAPASPAHDPGQASGYGPAPDASVPTGDASMYAPYAPYAPYPPLADQTAPPARGAAVTALVLGIVAILVGWLPLVGVILGVLAVVFGIVALARRQRKGLAVTGLVLGAWGLLTSIIASIIIIVVAVNGEEFGDAFWTGFQNGLAGESVSAPFETAPSDGATAGDDAETFSRSDFAALDDKSFAALVDDPAAAYGEQYVIHGEVQYIDEEGDCAALVIVDDARQTSWEGYATSAWVYPSVDDGSCGDLDRFEELTHVKLWVTAYGVTTTEWEDGTADDVLVFAMADFEVLPALP